MIKITDNLEEHSTFKIDGKEYKLNLGFKNVLKYFELIKQEKYIEGLYELFGQDNLDIELNNIVLFTIINKLNELLFEGSSGKKIFSLEQDFKYYYAEFIKYGVDLLTDNIHWEKFKLILSHITSSDTLMAKVLSYRASDGKGLKGRARADFMRKKRAVALERTDEEINEDIGNKLMQIFKPNKKG